MQEEFCTILDDNYLVRGLALYRTLDEARADFRLRVFCLDKATTSILSRMELPKLVPTAIDELESYDPALRAVKADRSAAEYCWTAKSVMCLYCFDNDPRLRRITYIDADHMCFHNPVPVFREMGDASILLVPNRGLEGDDMGSYIAGIISFRRDANAVNALRWWRDRCLEWCYDDFDEGKYADQGYLEDWPTRFAGVHVLEHPGGNVGPWNAELFELEKRNGGVLVDGEPLVFYHAVARWLYRGPLTALTRRGFLSSHYRVVPGPVPLVWATAFPLPSREHALLEAPYMRRVSEALAEIRQIDPDFEAGFVRLGFAELGYSVARRLLPPRLRQPLKRALLSRRPKKRGPPGSRQ